VHPDQRRLHQGRTRWGTLVRKIIPGVVDHYAPRPALVYVPAIAERQPALRLPVLVLLHGTPGAPEDWTDKGAAVATADAFAARHGGLAPIIVMPDINGSYHGDSECIRTPSGGDVEHYLQITLPQWVIAHLPADRDRRHWAVAGLSEGGTCAAMLALSEPHDWAAFADMSGLAHLTLGKYDDPALARRVLFDGSSEDFDTHDPMWLAEHHRYTGLSAWIFSGAGDVVARRQQALMVRSARASGIRTTEVVGPGAHRWPVWAAAFQQALPWLWTATAA
jgi:S-formylglutathione hydrolase FrmB